MVYYLTRGGSFARPSCRALGARGEAWSLSVCRRLGSIRQGHWWHLLCKHTRCSTSRGPTSGDVGSVSWGRTSDRLGEFLVHNGRAGCGGLLHGGLLHGWLLHGWLLHGWLLHGWLLHGWLLLLLLLLGPVILY